MSNDQWQLVEKIFDQALEQPPGERSAFLDDACGGSPEIRREVEELLSHHGIADDREFLNTDGGISAPPDAFSAPEDPYIGTDLGSYRIQRRLGHGGMGNVYLAVRNTDFRQQVAIKLLRRGMDTESILQRFRNEIQVLAAVSKHENIAGLQDAGTTDDGLPYFVMEYVEGEPLDAYCDHHRLTVDERIALFRQVCAAVHFAHQHMIIHRDLKMSNILVRSDGVPKLIDFGIAKLTTPELGTGTMTPTNPEERFITLEYASPEQARGDSLTAASDVYALGIILHELLTGGRPYNLSADSAADRLSVICDFEPTPPSTTARQKEDGDGSAEIFAARRTTVKRLQSRLSGDLDNIVLKSLRKEPQRRYGTAESFADDLGRYLDGSPVEARPIGATEHILRWCRRNPAPAALLVTVLLVFSGGVWHLSRLSDDLMRTMAIDGAALESKTLEIVQDFYTKAIVAKVPEEVPVSHLYAAIEGAIPVPATFTIDLGEHIRKSKITNMSARMYSDLPFKGRDGGGPEDAFQATALTVLKKDVDIASGGNAGP
jgi:serine/threonine protein kinase